MRDPILLALMHGPKRPKELERLLKGKMARSTLYRHLNRYVKRGIVKKQKEKTNGGSFVLYAFSPELLDLEGLEIFKIEPYELATEHLVNERLSELERAFGSQDINKEAIQGFFELCFVYGGITFEPSGRERVLRILANIDDPRLDESCLSNLLMAWMELVWHVECGKENPAVVSAIRENLHKLEKICIAKPRCGFLALHLIKTVDEDKADELLPGRMLGIKGYSMDDLVRESMGSYRDRLDKLLDGVDKLSVDENPYVRERAMKFKKKIEDVIFLRKGLKTILGKKKLLKI